MSGERSLRAQRPRRLFFALWPDEPARRSLAQAAGAAVRASGGRAVPAENLHLTLAFLGGVPGARLGELTRLAREAAGTWRTPGIELQFGRLEYWAAVQILCAPAQPRDFGVRELAENLLVRLAASGFAPDLKPFRPHVTVARQVRQPPGVLAMAPQTWRTGEFVLIESRTEPAGPLYSVVESYPLDGPKNLPG